MINKTGYMVVISKGHTNYTLIKLGGIKQIRANLELDFTFAQISRATFTALTNAQIEEEELKLDKDCDRF
jgi:hypothetical protein